jgi:V-type H+-transporting ATPase subunit E
VYPSTTTTATLANIYSAGGVSIVGGKGKIDINNTLEERLRLLEIDALPMVRSSLFGENQNRKFYD